MENLSLKAQQQADLILRPGSQNITQNCSVSELNHLANEFSPIRRMVYGFFGLLLFSLQNI